MKGIGQYLKRITRDVFHRGDTFAVEGGIPFGPGRDPKGSFYGHPKLSIYWYQPESAAIMEEAAGAKGLIKNLVVKIGALRLSA